MNKPKVCVLSESDKQAHKLYSLQREFDEWKWDHEKRIEALESRLKMTEFLLQATEQLALTASKMATKMFSENRRVKDAHIPD